MEAGSSELEDLRGREKPTGDSKRHEVDNSARPSWAGCQENGAAPTPRPCRSRWQAPSLETGGPHTALSRQELRGRGSAPWARTGPRRRSRWGSAVWGTGGLQPEGGKEGRHCPAPGLGKEREETPRNAVAWTVERDSQFLDRFYSKEPREEVRSGGKK